MKVVLTSKTLEGGKLLITLVHPEAKDLQAGTFLYDSPKYVIRDKGEIQILYVEKVEENREAKGAWNGQRPFFAKCECSFKPKSV